MDTLCVGLVYSGWKQLGIMEMQSEAAPGSGDLRREDCCGFGIGFLAQGLQAVCHDF